MQHVECRTRFALLTSNAKACVCAWLWLVPLRHCATTTRKWPVSFEVFKIAQAKSEWIDCLFFSVLALSQLTTNPRKTEGKGRVSLLISGVFTRHQYRVPVWSSCSQTLGYCWMLSHNHTLIEQPANVPGLKDASAFQVLMGGDLQCNLDFVKGVFAPEK